MIERGTIVRSYDFPGIVDDVYVEGILLGYADCVVGFTVVQGTPEGMECPHYVIVVTAISEGREDIVGSAWMGRGVFPPVENEGRGGVVVVEREAGEG